VLTGSNATFTVVASGAGTLSYRWTFNGTNLTNSAHISGATSSSLTVSNVIVDDGGSYRVIVSNNQGSITSSVATLTVLLPPSVSPPVGTDVVVPVLLNSNVTFSRTATGTAPLSYQWYFNSSPMSDAGRFSGATTTNLNITNVQTNDAGSYRLVITNLYGSATSDISTLSVVFPANVLTSPANRRVLEGGVTTFSVTFTGTAPLNFHWQKEGIDLVDDARISGSTNASLTISNLQFADAGNYRVVVSNAYGVAISDLAVLTVATNLPPLSGSVGVWGDLDNDGLMDVLLAGAVQGVAGIPDGRFTRIYHNAGAGIFDVAGTTLPQLDNAAAAWGDFDNDGDLDLLVSGLADGPDSVTEIYRNDGNNQFTKLNAGLEALAQGSVAWVDFDNDGLPDVFVTGLNSVTTNWVTRLYRNNGNGSFSLAITNLPTPQNARGSWTDYDNDGDVDLLLAGSGAAYLFRNEGVGVFTNAGLSIPSQHRVISPWGDFDGDGDLDFMTSSGTMPSIISPLDYHPSFTRNDGTGTFTSAFDYSLDMWLFNASWGDIDNSGRACAVVAGWVPLVPGGGVWGSAKLGWITTATARSIFSPPAGDKQPSGKTLWRSIVTSPKRH
jgi:hypothetical protein